MYHEAKHFLRQNLEVLHETVTHKLKLRQIGATETHIPEELDDSGSIG